MSLWRTKWRLPDVWISKRRVVGDNEPRLALVVEVHDHPPRARKQVVPVDGLQQVVVDLLTQRVHSVLVVRRRVNQEKVSMFQAVGQLDARAVWHVDVHEHHIGANSWINRSASRADVAVCRMFNEGQSRSI